jgi:hypothetical protein
MADSVVNESAKLSASIPFQVSVETYLMKLQELLFADIPLPAAVLTNH